jgi:hypothetical protein
MEVEGMALLYVERIGGLAGFGAARAHVRSRGEIDTDALTAADQRSVEALFHPHRAAKPSQKRDGFFYRIARDTPGGRETIEVSEDAVPDAISQCVKDELI